jgi:hypothetical protein
VTVAQEIASAIMLIKQRMGDADAAAPYQVIARFHRRFIDANRSAHKVTIAIVHVRF